MPRLVVPSFEGFALLGVPFLFRSILQKSEIIPKSFQIELIEAS